VVEGEPYPSLSLDQVPDALSNLTADTLLIIRVTSLDVRGETSAAAGIATGLLSLLVTGGAMMVVSTVVDGHITEAMLVDTRGEEILWYNHVQHTGSERSNYEIAKLLAPLTSTGLNLIPVNSEVVESSDGVEVVTTRSFDLSGKYESVVTTSGSGYTGFFPRSERSGTMTITQDGDELKARFGSNGFIEGRVDGDKVYFEWFNTSGGIGEWRINEASNRLSGTWKSLSWNATGEWSLRKIGEPIKITQRSQLSRNQLIQDISGTYVSNITSSHYWRFNTEEQRTMRLEIRQEGDQVIAENKEFDLKIVGTRNGNHISFYALPNSMTQYEITGEWNLVPNTTRLKGNWDLTHSQHPAKGNWDLRKIQ